jgi:adenylate cyclase
LAAVTKAELRRRGLYDPKAEGAAARLELLEFLAESGVTVDEMVEANSRGRLVGVLFDRAVGIGGERLTLAQVAAQALLSVDAAAAARRAMGLPVATDSEIYTSADAQALRVYRIAEGLFGTDVTLQITRVIGSSMSRIAEAEVASFLVNIAAPLAAEDAGEAALARANADVAVLTQEMSRLLDVLHRQHLEIAIRRFNVPRSELANYETFDMAVGFADMVGFTGLSEQLSTRELATTIADFEERTAVLVDGAGGRIVKLIGDEVMFVADDPAHSCDVAAQVITAFDGHGDLPPLRVGLAWGPVLARDGDYFGSVVNIASRSAKLARPGTALVSRPLREVVGDAPEGWRFGARHHRRIKGFDRRVPLHTMRRVRQLLPSVRVTSTADHNGRP